MIKNAYEINRRLVFTLRILGIGGEGLNKFCGFMDIGNGIGNEGCQSCVNHIHVAASEVSETVFKRAIDEEQKLNAMHGNREDHLTVSGDGTWKKRGWSSLFGVSTLIGQYSKKAVDAIVKSSFCQACIYHKNQEDNDIDEFDAWYEGHEENCSSNHAGSAGKMEIDAVTEMFERS